METGGQYSERYPAWRMMRSLDEAQALERWFEHWKGSRFEAPYPFEYEWMVLRRIEWCDGRSRLRNRIVANIGRYGDPAVRRTVEFDWTAPEPPAWSVEAQRPCMASPSLCESYVDDARFERMVERAASDHVLPYPPVDRHYRRN